MGATDAPIIAFMTTMWVGMAGAIGYLYKAERKCRKEMSTMRQDLTSLQVAYEMAQWTGELPIYAQIVINAESGLIVLWNPGATMIFGWSRADMMGKKLTTIIPDRYRVAHIEAMRKLLKKGGMPNQGPHYLDGLHKEGYEVRIEATYQGWFKDDQYYVGAIVKKLSGTEDGRAGEDHSHSS